MEPMKKLKARVVKGRLVMNAPTRLPEGTQAELMIAADEDLDGAEREALHAAIRQGAEQADRGETRPISETLAKLGK